MLTPGGMPTGMEWLGSGQGPIGYWTTAWARSELGEDGEEATLGCHPHSAIESVVAKPSTPSETAASKIRLTECQGCEIQWGPCVGRQCVVRAQSARRMMKVRSVISSISPVVHSFCSSSTKSRRIFRAEFASAWV